MSGTDQSQVKAFKTAFNIKPTEPSWDKVKAGMANGQKELRKWADLLSDVAPLSDAFHKVETSRVTMEEACTKCEELYDKSGDAKSKRNIVSKVRDKILPELLKQIDECRKAAKNLQVAQSVHTKVHGPDGSGDVEHDIDKDVAVFWTDIPGFTAWMRRSAGPSWRRRRKKPRAGSISTTRSSSAKRRKRPRART